MINLQEEHNKINITKQIDRLVQDCSKLPIQSHQNLSKQNCRNIIQRTLQQKIKQKLGTFVSVTKLKQAHQHKFYTAEEYEKQIMNHLYPNDDVDRKRGRPLKFIKQQKLLAEWIRSSGRSHFTKKQIDYQYCRIFKEKKRNIPIYILQRILDNHDLKNISITKNKMRPNKKRNVPMTIEPQQSIGQNQLFDQYQRMSPQRSFTDSYQNILNYYDVGIYLNLDNSSNNELKNLYNNIDDFNYMQLSPESMEFFI